MPNRLKNLIKFRLERLLLRGTGFRLLIIAALIGLVALAGGVLAYATTAGFNDAGAAIWWAFLRLTDPGYLGDDEGVLLRTVSTVLTVLGSAIFLGALIAILTQWLNETIEDLERGLTPIAQNNHVLILGWTNRTPTVVRELVLSEGRVQRFLQRRGARDLHIVVLAERVSAGLRHDLRDRLGRLWDERQITLRTGSSLRIEHLRRVDFGHAAAILIPAADFPAPQAVNGPELSSGSTSTDTRTIKTLLSITNDFSSPDGRTLPLVVAEVFDARKIPIARRAYAGPIELLASDAIISRLIAQNVRHPGLSQVYGELLTHGHGNEIYIRECPELRGKRLDQLPDAFPGAVLLGAVRKHGNSFRPLLNPPPGFAPETDDRLVLLARSYAEAAAVGNGNPAPPERRESFIPPPPRRRQRILIMGWSHKLPALLHEFDQYERESFEIDVLSAVSLADRAADLDRYDLRLRRTGLRQLEGDYTIPSELARIGPAEYDNVVLLGSDWLPSGYESDARTILGYMLLRELLPPTGGPEVLVELLDPENVRLFRRRPGEVLISPLILSHMLAQVALRRELRAVFDELFGPAGAEISFRPATDYLDGGREVTFREIQHAVVMRGHIALGLRRDAESADAGGLRLNPPRDQRWSVAEGDEVVVLTNS